MQDFRMETFLTVCKYLNIQKQRRAESDAACGFPAYPLSGKFLSGTAVLPCREKKWN